MKILITGYGAISALGNNVPEHLDALKNGRTGIKTGTRDYSKMHMVGEVPGLRKELITKYDLQVSGSRTTILGAIAAKEAFQNHAIHPSIRTGLISGTSVGGMDLSEIIYRDMQVDRSANYELLRNHPSGDSTTQIAKQLGIVGFHNTISTACSSAANAIIMGARMLKSGMLDRVVVGGTDALSEFTVNGFRSLMILSDEWTQPFDENRKGLNLGEGAGYLVLETEASNAISQAPIVGVLAGYGTASDAFHQTASSPEGLGAQLAIREALKVAELEPVAIDYINAHGTGTPNNDLSESKAIQAVFGEIIPPFSSTKANTGHTLAACGGLEAVFSLLAIQNGLIYPNLNHSTTIVETDLAPAKRLMTNQKIDYVLSNSFGFGGNNTSLIFGKK